MKSEITSASRELMFLTMVMPKMPDIAPDKQAPTTTHTSNIVTNFDVADRMLMNDGPMTVGENPMGNASKNLNENLRRRIVGSSSKA